MASNIRIAAVDRKVMLDALVAKFNGQTLSIYSGSQPADADTAVPGGDVLLAQFTLPNPAFTTGASTPSATYSVTANGITAVNASATGVAAWFRLSTSDSGNLDGTVGLSSADLIISPSTSIVINTAVQVSSLTLQMGV